MRRALVLLTVAACGGGHSGDDSTADAYVPSCTPVAGTPALGLVEIATGFDMPVYVTSPPGDSQRLFVLEKTGAIRIIDHGTVLPDPFLTVITPSIGGLDDERGLLGLEFAPDYQTSGHFYVYYVDADSNERIEQYTVGADPDHADASSAQPVFSNQDFASNHNGGHMQFGQDGYLWFGVGDGGGANDPMQYGQNLDVTFGKLMRLDVSHLPPTAPPDNPFVGTGHDETIWSYGWRNPWRWSFDKQTGDLYVGDVGQDTWEEIDVTAHDAPGGNNYGWSEREGDGCFGGGTGCLATGVVDPVFTYQHGDLGECVIGGYVYRGCVLPGYAGTYFFADYSRGWVRSLQWDGAGSYTNLQEWPSLEGGDIVSFGQDADGELYIVRQDTGQIMKIVPQS